MRYYYLHILLVTLLLPSFSFAVCQKEIPHMSLNQKMLESMSQTIQDSPIRLAILPFHDGSQIKSDPTLEKGFSLAFYDFLKDNSSLSVYHPFIVWNAIEKRKISSQNLFDTTTVNQVANDLKATHLVYGMFQKQGEGSYRYFIKVRDVAQSKRLGAIIEAYTRSTNLFFQDLSESSLKILENMNIKKTVNFQELVKSSPKFEAYRYYIKGMIKSQSYKSTALEVAKAWFEKSLTLSYHFSGAFQEKARVLFMIAMLQRFRGQDASLIIGEANYLLKQQPLLQGKSSRKKNKKNYPSSLPSSVGPYRWMNAYLKFSSGISLLQSGQANLAINDLKEALELTPEDAMIAYYYSDALKKAGQAKASDWLKTAKSLNPCLN